MHAVKTNQMKTRIILILAGLTILTFTSTRAFAVEGGLGRPISGMSIAPFAGVVPPEPGLAVLTGDTYYEGSIGGGRTVPIAGLLVPMVDIRPHLPQLTLLYI